MLSWLRRLRLRRRRVSDDLSPAERELIAKHRAEQAAEDEPEFEYEIGRGDNYARVSSKSKAGKKIAGFFRESFGIDLADEPVQDDAEPVKDEPKPRAVGRSQAKGDSTVQAFKRRIS
jgi:hypothetical protein